jgi:two-component system cell cycle response regulator
METLTANLLVVEDNVDLLDFLADDLEEKYHVKKALNGTEAIELLQKHHIDLVISDIMMPTMDGYELCRYLKNNPKYAHIPLILLTSKSTIESKIEGLGIGADAYIEKPFYIEFIRAQIHSLLENRIKFKDYIDKSISSKISLPTNKSLDIDFLNQIENIILDHIDDQNFSIDTLSEILCMSRPTLYRKLSTITDISPHEIINKIKLEKSVEMLTKSNLKLYEVSLRLGYSSTTHFTRNFIKYFGVAPKEYLDIKKEK